MLRKKYICPREGSLMTASNKLSRIIAVFLCVGMEQDICELDAGEVTVHG